MMLVTEKRVGIRNKTKRGVLDARLVDSSQESVQLTRMPLPPWLSSRLRLMRGSGPGIGRDCSASSSNCNARCSCTYNHQMTCIRLYRCGCNKYETNLDPAGRVFDVVSGVVRTPALDEAESQDAQFAQLVHTDARRHWHACQATKYYTIMYMHM